MVRNLKIGVLVISCVLFIVSLTQPAFYTSAQEPDGWANSLGLVVFGWSGALGGDAGLAWFANPLIFLSWIFLFGKTKRSVTTSFFAVLFAGSFLLFKDVLTGEDGTYSIITQRKAGYWLWFLSIVVFALGSTFIYLKEKSLKNTLEQDSANI
jgi:hypothetical protein